MDSVIVDSPSDSPADSLPPDGPPKPYLGFSDTTTGDTPGFYLFSVYGTSTDTSTFAGTFQAFPGRITTQIINIDCDPTGPTETTIVAELGVTLLGSGATQKYQMSKNVTQLGLVTGNCYRVKPRLDGFTLGFTDLQVTSGQPPAPLHRATPSSNLTVKFRTEASLALDSDGDGVPDWRD